jgi:hypothetical protein
MKLHKFAMLGVCLGVAAMAATSSVAQSCTSSQDAAVQCFVGNAVKTNLSSLRYGMTMTQFKAYGVAVSRLLQDQQDYLVLAGMASAIADAMPPTNADGSANPAAQQAAVTSIVQAEIADGMVTLPAEVSEQQTIYFSLDMVTSMNETKGIMMSPGFLLRVTDSYVVTATANGAVDWTTVNSSLATMVSNLSSAGLLKLPVSVTLTEAQTFAQNLAQAIYTYKVATGRTSL